MDDTRDFLPKAHYDQAKAVEGHLVGAAILDPRRLDAIGDKVSHADFWDADIGRAFMLLASLRSAGKPIQDPSVLVAELKKANLLGPIGGEAGIARLAGQSVASSTNWYAHEVKRLAEIRRNALFFARMVADCQTPNADPVALRSQAIATLQGLADETETVQPISLSKLLSDHAELDPILIDGLLRQREVCNIIASPKVGKSFLSHNLAWSIATGQPWLDHDVVEGKVLIIDNELRPATLASRIKHVSHAMEIDREKYSNAIDMLSLRGRLCDIHSLGQYFQNIDPGTYALVIIDALYRMLPVGTSENDNAAMTAVFNRLDQYAETLDCAIVCIHHSTKGSQGDKSVTDVGAGAGSVSRAADTHLVIRPHEQDDHFVLEAVCRSFKSPPPVTISFDWPLWHATTMTPEVKRVGQRRDEKAAKDDLEADKLLLDALAKKPWLSESQLVRVTGMGPSRISRAIGRAVTAGVVTQKKVKRGSRKVAVYGPSATASATGQNDARIKCYTPPM